MLRKIKRKINMLGIDILCKNDICKQTMPIKPKSYSEICDFEVMFTLMINISCGPFNMKLLKDKYQCLLLLT